MDLSFSEDQEELRALARRILTDRCTPEHLRAVSEEAADGGSGTDLDLWRSLAEAGLVGISLPEAAGGGDFGWLETAIVLEEIARVAAPVPGLAVMALAGPAFKARADLLEGVVEGTSVVTAAFHEPVGDPWTPGTQVDGARLTGSKVCVPHGLLADRFAVTAADGLYVVEAGAPGVAISRQDTTSGVPDAAVEFDAAPAERIGGRDEVDALLRRGISAAAVMTAAACGEALRLTAAYAVEREQFGKPIAAFQAVSQRVGDAYIDTEAVRLTAWHAAWRLDRGLPADAALLSAKYWAAEGGWRVVHSAQHVHGGVGVDRDYPLFRYFLMHKQLELLLGSATPTLQRLGRLLAE